MKESYGEMDNKKSWEVLLLMRSLKNALSCLTQFLETKIPLKMMKNAFHLYIKFLSWIFGHAEKLLD